MGLYLPRILNKSIPALKSTPSYRLTTLRHQTTVASDNNWRQGILEKDQYVNAFTFTYTNSNSKIKPENEGSLNGLAIAVKDNIVTNDTPTTCSSNILQNFHSPFDATVVKLLYEAGADLIGKTNLDEFGMGSLTRYSSFGPTINPFQHPHPHPSTKNEKDNDNEKVAWEEREKRYPGGSSGGSAAAVSAGMCYAALGTDTGGSVRLPASYCGIVGLKPSYGLVSRWGVVSYADSLDCVGVLASKVRDVKNVFDVISAYDERDPTSAIPEVRQRAEKDVKKRLDKWENEKNDEFPLNGIRIGIPQEYFPAELSPAIIQAIRNVIKGLEEKGAIIIPISLPSTSFALSSYYVIASAEASSNLARYDGIRFGSQALLPNDLLELDISKTSNVYARTRSKYFGKEVKKRILLGTYALTADAFDNYFLQAQRVRQLVKNDFNRVFGIRNWYFDTSSSPSSSSSFSSTTTTTTSSSSLSSYSTTQERQDSNMNMNIDVIIHPSSIRTAPLIKTNNNETNMESLEESYVQDVLTVPASLAGIPALSIPISNTLLMNDDVNKNENGKGGKKNWDGWPVGVSVVGQWGCDELVVRIGEVVEQLK